MRRNGIFTAAALHALDHHLNRLGEDHDNARPSTQVLAVSAPVTLDLATVQTNIVVFHLPAEIAVDATTLGAQARSRAC